MATEETKAPEESPITPTRADPKRWSEKNKAEEHEEECPDCYGYGSCECTNCGDMHDCPECYGEGTVLTKNGDYKKQHRKDLKMWNRWFAAHNGILEAAQETPTETALEPINESAYYYGRVVRKDKKDITKVPTHHKDNVFSFRLGWMDEDAKIKREEEVDEE